ncbi:MAG: hypothetical protein U0802_17680 [Candidatus Binatia bacterium]
MRWRASGWRCTPTATRPACTTRCWTNSRRGPPRRRRPLPRPRRRYLRAAALRSYNLNDAGTELPAFLRTDPLGRELPFLPDLAGLERALTRAFHAADAAPLTAAHLAALAPESFLAGRVRFQPSVAVCASPWPIHALWLARETPHGEIDVDLTAGEQVIVWRADLHVDCQPIAREPAAALQALLAGATVVEVAERHDDLTAVVAWLADCIGRGLVVACAVV